MISEYVKVEIVNHINIVENVIVEDIVPSKAKFLSLEEKIRYLIYDEKPLFWKKRFEININDPPEIVVFKSFLGDPL